MKLNNIIKTALGLCFFLGAVSCSLKDFLEKPVTEDILLEDIFSTRELATRAMNSCYENLPFGMPYDGVGNPGVPSCRPGVCVGQSILDNLSDLFTTVFINQNGPKYYYYLGNYNSSLEQSSPGFFKYSFAHEKQWVAIRRCWQVIENIDKVPDMEDAEKAQYKAEARTIIAVHYTQMLRHLGGVPKVDHAYAADEDMKTVRMTIGEMLEWIDTLIEDSYRDLPYNYSNPNLYGRMTRPGALAVRVRAYHFAASPLYNDDKPYLDGPASEAHYTWLGKKDNSLWKKTADLADELIEDAVANGYGLVQPNKNNQAGYKAAFRKAYHSPNNGETLITTRCKQATYTGAISFMSNIKNGNVQVTQNFADMFPTSKGWDIKPGMPNYNPDCGWDEQKPNDNRDPRYYETVSYNNMPWGKNGAKGRFWKGGEDQLFNHLVDHGTTCTKFNLGGSKQIHLMANGLPMVWPYIRLAEIYLIYAEAANQYEGAPSAKAYERVNAVRARVGLNALEGMDKNTFHEAVMKERCCELGMEEQRWFDIIRWKMQDAFTATLRGMESWIWVKNPGLNTYGLKEGTRADSYDGDYLIGDGTIGDKGVMYEKLVGRPANVNFDAKKHVLTYKYYDFPESEIRAWARDFSPKWYLSAFPMGEVNKDYGLVQNPGW